MLSCNSSFINYVWCKYFTGDRNYKYLTLKKYENEIYLDDASW